jgi:hypothetical protein
MSFPARHPTRVKTLRTFGGTPLLGEPRPAAGGDVAAARPSRPPKGRRLPVRQQPAVGDRRDAGAVPPVHATPEERR